MRGIERHNLILEANLDTILKENPKLPLAVAVMVESEAKTQHTYIAVTLLTNECPANKLTPNH